MLKYFSYGDVLVVIVAPIGRRDNESRFEPILRCFELFDASNQVFLFHYDSNIQKNKTDILSW